MTAPRTNVAILSVGAIGTGDHEQGIPALVECLIELSQDIDLSVYSLLNVNPDRAPPGIRLRPIPFRTPFVQIDLVLMSLMVLWDHIRRPYDGVHTVAAYPFGWVGVRLGRLLNVPCLVALQGQELANLPSADFGDLRNHRRSKRIADACERADVLTALSRFQALGLSELGIAPERAVVIPFGIDTSRFTYCEKLLTAPYRFLHVAYAHPVKDMETLLDTFRIINEQVDSRLVIVGHGHIGAQTETLVEKYSLKGNVELFESVPNRKVANYFQTAHFLLHTSRYESQGVVFNEAMASGVVVCATRVGLAADLGEEFCILSDVGDSGCLARKIMEVVSDNDRFEYLRSNGRRWSTQYDVNWTAAKYQDIYRQFIV